MKQYIEGKMGTEYFTEEEAQFAQTDEYADAIDRSKGIALKHTEEKVDTVSLFGEIISQSKSPPGTTIKVREENGDLTYPYIPRLFGKLGEFVAIDIYQDEKPKPPF